MHSDCHHIELLKENPENGLKQYNEYACFTCNFQGIDLWLCLENNCHFVGCSESEGDHGSVHWQETKHPLTLNLQTLKIWCYKCEKQVFYKQSLNRYLYEL